MNDTDYEKIGPFKVHRSIVKGLTGWEPNYWRVLTMETRQRIKNDTQAHFRSTLLAYRLDDVSDLHQEYFDYLILNAAFNTVRLYWRTVIYEHKLRLYEISHGRAGPCGAKKKNGQQCKAKAVRYSGRCRHHGGLSTGPKTIEGKIKSLSKLTQYQRDPSLLAKKREELISEMRDETGF